MFFGGFVLRFLMEDPLLANMSEQRMERNQLKDIGGSERKGIRRRSSCAWVSQHKLHHTHVSLFLHQPESVVDTTQWTARIEPKVRVLFSDSAHTR